MDIAIHGKQMDVGDALRTHAADRIADANEKYLGRATSATITFSREGRGHGAFRVHIFVMVGRNLPVNADAADADPYVAFNRAADKVEKAWRRYKRRVREDHRRDEAAAVKARDYVLSNLPVEEPEEEAAEAGEPAIVAEMVTELDALSVADAVARMDLGGQGALLFRNAGHGGLNMVYRRTDGHVGWVDPGPAEAKTCCKKEGGGGGCCSDDGDKKEGCCG